MRALLLALAFPASLAAQPMDCVTDIERAPKLAPVVAALDLLDTSLLSLRDALTRSVAEVCLGRPPLDARGYFEPDARRIVLASDLSDGMVQAVFFHELRHALQFESGVCPTPDLSMQEHAAAILAMEADASVAALVVADMLRSAGNDAMWQALATWPMQDDITAAFAAELDTTQDVQRAALVAFDAWYAREDRREIYYQAACLDYLDQQEREHLIPRYNSVDPNFFEDLCILPGGERYDCAGQDDE